MTVIARPMSGGAVGEYVGVEEALADADDRVGESGRVQVGVERAAIAFELDKPRQGGGHARGRRGCGCR